MGAPVASGTLAGSTSGSWVSNHKEAAGSDCSRLRRHPRVVGLATVAESDIVAGHDSATEREAAERDRRRRRREIRPAGEARRREPAVVEQPPVVRSTQFGGRRRSRPRGVGATIGNVAKASPARGRRDDRSPTMRSRCAGGAVRGRRTAEFGRRQERATGEGSTSPDTCFL